MGIILPCFNMFQSEEPAVVTQVKLEKFLKELQDAESKPLSPPQMEKYLERYNHLAHYVNSIKLKRNNRPRNRRLQDTLRRIKTKLERLDSIEKSSMYGTFPSSSDLEEKEANLKPSSRRTNNTKSSETKSTCHNDEYPTSESSKSQLMGDTNRQGIEDGNEDVEMGQPSVEESHRKRFEKAEVYMHNERQNQKESETGNNLKPNKQRDPFFSAGQEHRAIQEGSYFLAQTTNYTKRNYTDAITDDRYHKPEQKYKSQETAAERIASSVPSTELSYGGVPQQQRADSGNFNISSQRKGYSILEPHKSIDEPSPVEQQTNHEEEVRKENESHSVEIQCEAQPHSPPEPERQPLKILDVAEYFRDGLDLNSLNGLDVADQIDSIESHSRTFEDKVNNFSEEKFSLPYFVLDEKLMCLIEKLDKIESPNDELAAKKIRAIQYIKDLHAILDQRAIDEQ